MRRRSWLLVLGGVGVVVAAAIWFWPGRPDGFLLPKDQVEVAREHVQVREELLALTGQIDTPADLDEGAVRRLHVRRAFLQAHVGQSAFADLSLDALRDALQAAEDGYHADTDGVIARGIYGGTDDRQDYSDVVKLLAEEHDVREQDLLKTALDVSRGVGAWMHAWSLEGDASSSRLDRPVTLGAFWKLCARERFASQPKAALGTAFLVRPDIVVTAAHVLKLAPLRKLRLVFDFEVHDGKNPTELRRVCTPLRVLSSDAGDGSYDWAIILLEKPVADARVLPIARRSPRIDEPIYMWGHSLGTPKKFMRGRVLDGRAQSTSLRVELDAFGGDSGSPVLNEDHEVVGVLFGGSADLVKAHGRSCRVAATVRRGAGGEYVTTVENFRARIPR